MRKNELIFNLLILTGALPIMVSGIILILVSMVGSYPKIYFAAILFLLFIGFALFLKAKMSLIKQGMLFTFGAKEMSKFNRRLYFSGYLLMFLAVILSIGFLIYVSIIKNIGG